MSLLELYEDTMKAEKFVIVEFVSLSGEKDRYIIHNWEIFTVIMFPGDLWQYALLKDVSNGVIRRIELSEADGFPKLTSEDRNHLTNLSYSASIREVDWDTIYLVLGDRSIPPSGALARLNELYSTDKLPLFWNYDLCMDEKENFKEFVTSKDSWCTENYSKTDWMRRLSVIRELRLDAGICSTVSGSV